MQKGEDSVLQHYSGVRSFLDGFTGRPDLAEDLTQDTFARAYKWIERHGRQPEDPYPWLRSIARNAASDYFGREKDQAERLAVRGRDSLGEDFVSEPEALAGLVVLEEQEAATASMRQALESLSDLDRDLISGFYLEGHCCAYLGRSTGVGRRTVKVRLYRARAKMRRALNLEGGPSND